MSVHYNGQNIKEMYYNGQKISEAYYNGEKVFSGENVLWEYHGALNNYVFFQSPFYPAGTIIEWTPTTGFRYYGDDVMNPKSIPTGVNRFIAETTIKFLWSDTGTIYDIKLIAGA